MRISDWSSDVCSSDLPALLALVIVYGTVRWVWRAELDHTAVPPPDAPPLAEIDRWQIAKGLAATLLLVALFATPEPREVGALAIAAALLASRKLGSRAMIGAVDWQDRKSTRLNSSH